MRSARSPQSAEYKKFLEEQYADPNSFVDAIEGAGLT